MAANKAKQTEPRPAPAAIERQPTECHDELLLADDDDWLACFENAFCGEGGPKNADHFAHVIFRIIEAIETGPEGITRAVFTLRDGIRIAYKYTETHQAAFRLYYASLAGQLHPDDEPKKLITGALVRAGGIGRSGIEKA